MAKRADVLVIGAGPAGIATAIAASLKGLHVAVLDYRKPPIEKSCGEGLLPSAVSNLRSLGVGLSSAAGFPFCGIRFSDEEFSVSARIAKGTGYGVRRAELHRSLVERACQVGVSFHWGARVTGFDGRGAQVGGAYFPCRWLVGADGQNSTVGKWANLSSQQSRLARFGFSRHYAVPPWTDLVEVHWGPGCQIFLTPTGDNEICIALLSHDPQLRIERALTYFPEVAKRLEGSRFLTAELGGLTALGRARRVVSGHVALVGDASFTVDGITGQGLSLAFQQAILLAEAFERGDLDYYEIAHRGISRAPWRMTRLLLLMDQSTWLRRKVLRLFAGNPALFAKIMSAHMAEAAQESLKATEVLGLGWQVLRA
ncbi:MAG: NAD(P)/FAD-dependent oxidoreductase [Candidatus Acidiferrales bacterium]